MLNRSENMKKKSSPVTSSAVFTPFSSATTLTPITTFWGKGRQYFQHFSVFDFYVPEQSMGKQSCNFMASGLRSFFSHSEK